MMIPKVINEAEKKVFEDGSYIKQYVVHAPEWDLYHNNQVTRGEKVDYFVISESTRMGYLETLVFPCNEEGKVEYMREVAGGRTYTADEVLTSFALIMMEAGHDTV
tara:strand:+ start:224 stop:541 length:318 start_codon:yes stop_codon:yes gene_type:complete